MNKLSATISIVLGMLSSVSHEANGQVIERIASLEWCDQIVSGGWENSALAGHAEYCLRSAIGEIDRLADTVDELQTTVNTLTQTVQSLQGLFSPSEHALVVAFAGYQCPDGWEIFEQASGRFIVGNDGRPEWRAIVDSGDLVFAIGGEEQVTLTEAQMPAHVHQTVDAGDPISSAHVGGGIVERAHIGTRWEGNFFANNTFPRGGGQSHNNMPPYVALYWCTRATE